LTPVPPPPPNHKAPACDAGLAAGFNNLATAYRDLKDYDQAEALFRRSIELWNQDCEPATAGLATALNNLGELFFIRGRYSEAERLLREALQVREKALGPQHPDLATGYLSYATVLRKLKRKAEAEAYDLRAKALVRSWVLDGVDHSVDVKELHTPQH
jgi:tetratricopeptide (TPR) repeat protein